MDNMLRQWHIYGFFFTVIMGTVIHYGMVRPKKLSLLRAMCPINESMWENLKLLFFPAVLFSIIEYCVVGRYYLSFIPARACGIIFAMLFWVLLFYAFTPLLTRFYVSCGVFMFFASAASCFLLSWRLLEMLTVGGLFAKLACLLLLAALGFLLVRFSFHPRTSPLFLDSAGKK